MDKNKFLKRETRILAVTASVFMGLALAILIIIGLIGGNFLRVSTVGSCVILGGTSVLISCVQIRVFFDYKSKNKYLCADGIFNICLTILIAVTALVWNFNEGSVDLRYFIFAFAITYAIWKFIVAVIGFKQKRFNAFVELILACLWALSSVSVLLTAFNVNGSVLLLCISNYVLVVAFVFYILYSYIFKEPVFLETPEAIAMLNKEEEERQIRLNRFNRDFGKVEDVQRAETQKVQEQDIEKKLEKLKNLKDKGFITAEEYEEKRKKIFETEI